MDRFHRSKQSQTTRPTIGAPVTLEIIADGNGSLLQKDGSWKNSLLLTTDGSRMFAVQIKNNDWGSSGTIVFNVLTNSDPSSPAIGNFRIKYRTDYPAYVLFLMTLLGALSLLLTLTPKSPSPE